MQRLQREDALKHLREVDAAAAFPLQMPRREGKILLVLAGFLLLLNLIPNPWQGEVERQMAVRQEITQQQKQVEKVKKELAKKNEKAPSARREEGIKALEELQRKMSSAKKQEEAMKSLAAAEERLQKLSSDKQDHVNSDVERLSQALKQDEISRELGEKLATGDSREVEQSFAKMAEKVPTMSSADQQKLAASLNQSATAISDGRLKNQLNQAARTLNSGSARAAGGQLKSLGATLDTMSSQAAVNSDLARAGLALQSSRMAITAAGSSNNGNLAATGTACQNPLCNTPGCNGT
jgi:DNA repair exonuclease SbcCD ATPase subunit